MSRSKRGGFCYIRADWQGGLPDTHAWTAWRAWRAKRPKERTKEQATALQGVTYRSEQPRSGPNMGRSTSGPPIDPLVVSAQAKAWTPVPGHDEGIVPVRLCCTGGIGLDVDAGHDDDIQ